jgi:hypothetical protein
MALVSKKKKGKGNYPSKKSNIDGGTSQPGKKKDLSNIKCFAGHKNGYYASNPLGVCGTWIVVHLII